ncbi:MAG: hypothetical protein C5B46_07270 [Proteobacteria bacterium]|nr:MAG: hypothetical protein C5B46_07270 [Pseudomonadota bacterium]
MVLRFTTRVARSTRAAGPRLVTFEQQTAKAAAARITSTIARAGGLCLVSLALAAPAAAAIYSCEDASGRIVLRDAPCKRGEIAHANGAAPPPAPKRTPPPASATQAPTLTSPQVQTLIDSLDDAIARRDVTAILAHFANDAAVEMELRLPQGLRIENFDKTTYAANLKETLAPGTAFSYQREKPRIVLSSDQHQAEVISTVHETIVLDRKRLQGVTRSRLLVEWREGRLQITLARASTRFDADSHGEPAQTAKP